MEAKVEDTIFMKIIKNPTYYALASILEIFILILIIYKWDPLKITDKYPPLANIFIIFVGFTQLMTYYFVNNKKLNHDSVQSTKTELPQVFLKVFLTLLMICGSILFLFCFLWLLANFPTFSSIYTFIVDVLIIIFSLALIYLFFKFTTAQQQTGFLKLIGQLVMYIPCLVIDIIDWFKEQYKITTKTIWLILAMEIILIILRFILPILANFIVNLNGTHLLEDPIYLNNSKVLGNVGDFYNKDDNPSYRYSLSGWFWINPQPPNTGASYIKYTNILQFGKKPSVEYNSLEHTLRINCQIKGKKEITIVKTKKVGLQKWNYIVINYDGGTMDVFLNGELIGSQPDVAPYITQENITVGADNGIEGGICNVIYHKDILKERQISLAYKSLSKMRNPII